MKRASGENAPLGVTAFLAERVDAELVLTALREVIDPELGVNIVDLGLVYGLSVSDEGDVFIRMTLTTPGCPLGGYLDDEIRACLSRFPALGDVAVQLVWDPAWSPTMMSDEARRQLGWLR